MLSDCCFGCCTHRHSGRSLRDLEESTSEFQLVIAGFARKSGTANGQGPTAPVSWMQPQLAPPALRCAARLVDSSVPWRGLQNDS